MSGGAGGGLRQLQLGYHRRDGALQVRRGVERGGDPQHPHCAGNGEGDAVSDEGQMERGRVRARRGVSVCVRTDGDDHRVELLVREDAAQLRRRLCAGRAPRLCRAANCTCTPRSPRGHQRKFDRPRCLPRRRPANLPPPLCYRSVWERLHKFLENSAFLVGDGGCGPCAPTAGIYEAGVCVVQAVPAAPRGGGASAGVRVG